jgi:hypothetical protein
MSKAADNWSLLDICWFDLVEKSDRTSPADHPDMALITREELRDYMSMAHDEGYGVRAIEEGKSTDA